MKCSCGHGKVSNWDGKCGHCRTKNDRKMLATMQRNAITAPGLVSIHNKHRDPATPEDVYVGRGSPLGNPFPIDVRAGQTRRLVIQAYREWLRDRIKEGDKKVCDALNDIANASLNGKAVNLVCFCHPHDCHARIIKDTVDAAVRSELATVNQNPQH